MKIEWIISESGMISQADIGNYIRLEVIERKSDKKYVLYLHIKKWKEDGCRRSKVCQAQEVASFKAQTMDEAKENAEKWFINFVKDMISFSDFSLQELL